MQPNISERLETAYKGISKLYGCDKCEVEFNDRSNLRHHKLRVHENIKHKCEECDFIGFEINKHKKTKHKGFRYECDQCNAKLLNSYILTRDLPPNLQRLKNESTRLNSDCQVRTLPPLCSKEIATTHYVRDP